MIRRLARSTDRQHGFTIIELMVTMLILGVLVGIVVMTMAISRTKAQQASCKANLRIIVDAIAQYQAIHEGALPPTLDVLVDEHYIKENFSWTCPSGDYGSQSGDYRKYYNPETGQTSCPRPDHNL
jgi:prepilin-type N-terminal cleavage/methylation domain-containing protein